MYVTMFFLTIKPRIPLLPTMSPIPICSDNSMQTFFNQQQTPKRDFLLCYAFGRTTDYPTTHRMKVFWVFFGEKLGRWREEEDLLTWMFSFPSTYPFLSLSPSHLSQSSSPSSLPPPLPSFLFLFHFFPFSLFFLAATSRHICMKSLIVWNSQGCEEKGVWTQKVILVLGSKNEAQMWGVTLSLLLYM